MSRRRHGRRVMVGTPSARIRHIHLIAQHVPHHTGLHPGSQGLHHRHVVQRGQSLIDGKTAPVPTPEHLFQQFPEFAFSHDRQCTHIPTPYPPQPGDPRTPPLTPASAAAPNHRKRRGGGGPPPPPPPRPPRPPPPPRGGGRRPPPPPTPSSQRYPEAPVL